MAEDSVAQDQIKAFVDRILRLKGEVKEINADVREIYSEAKGNGFDKTVLGKLVNYVEKRQENSAAVEESESIFDLYLTAYDSAKGKVGTVRATHMHASEERADRSKARLSEAMDDNKAFSAELVADGLISAEAHAQNIALADAVATKLGAGIISTVAALRADPEMSIVSADNLKYDPRPDGAAQTELVRTSAPSPVESEAVEISTPIQPETATSSTAVRMDAPNQNALGHGAMNAEEAGTQAPSVDTPPSPGKSVGASASAAPAAEYGAPGVITWERTPPEGVRRHEYSQAFGDAGQDSAVIEDDLASAASAPIVKIGKEILDGWARYMRARSMDIEYPVVQYDGSDPLIDCIRWNFQGRMLNSEQTFRIAQKLTKLNPKRKADIYAAMELGMELVS